MSLTIGELVGILRADDAGWRSGLASARLRMHGLQRDTEGRLRDLRGRFISEGDAAGRGFGHGIIAHAGLTARALAKVGPAALGILVGIPAAAALTTALMGIAAGATAAGLAVGGFFAAAKPQLKDVTEASAAAQKADAAHAKVLVKKEAAAQLAAKGGKEYKKALAGVRSATMAARDADIAAQQAMSGLPPATRATAVAFAGLKGDYKRWSDSLAGSTMPVFTKGIGLLRTLLPQLTPFVKAGASALGDFVDKLAKGSKSSGFKTWMRDMAASSGKALRDLLGAVGNFGKGFAGILHAFLPVSSSITGGFLAMSQAFANWGVNLGKTEGFAKFLEMARAGSGSLGTLAKAALQLLDAASPLLGVTSGLALWLAKLLAATPPGVLTAIGIAWGSIALAIKLYNTYVMVSAAVTRAWAIAQAVFNAVMAANPIFLVIGLIVALGVALFVAYQKSETFRQGVQIVWQAIRTAVSAAVSGVLTAIGWLGTIPGKVSGWFGGAKDAAVRKGSELLGWVRALPGRIISGLSSLGGSLASSASGAWQRFKDGAVSKGAALLGWVRGLPGRIKSALGTLGGLLVGAGHAVVQGLWNGISSMGGWLAGKLMGWAKSIIPGPIAKALGIGSPSKVTRAQGRWIAIGLIDGLTGSSKDVRTASARLADIVRDALSGGREKRALARITKGENALLRLAARDEAVTSRLKSAQKNLAGLLADRDKLIGDVRGGVLSGGAITGAGDGSPLTASSILAGLQGSVSQAIEFAANLAKLRKLGVRSDLIAQIAQAGVQGGSGAAAALAHATKGELQQINSQQAALVRAADKAGVTAGDAMYGAGIKAARGLVAGLQREQSAIERQMLIIAKGMSTAIRRALGIRSPSRVMAAIGEFIPRGLVQGIEGGRPLVDRSMASLVSMPSVGALAGAGAAASGAGAAGGGGRLVLEFSSDGTSFGDALVEVLRDRIRIKGGDVQTVLGKRRQP